MNGRIYDPLLGRFLSADTVVQFPGNLQSFNRYSYVQNNPLSLVDPSGFEAAAAAAALPQLARDTAPALPVAVGVALSNPLTMTVAAGAVVTGGGMVVAGPQSSASAATSRTPYFCDVPWGMAMMNLRNEQAANQQTTVQSNNGQQAAAEQATNQANAQSTAPQPAVSQNAPVQNSSGGQMNSQEPPDGKNRQGQKKLSPPQAIDGNGRPVADGDLTETGVVRTEPATGKNYRGGKVVETEYKDATGLPVTKQTIYDKNGRVVHEHYRPGPPKMQTPLTPPTPPPPPKTPPPQPTPPEKK